MVKHLHYAKRISLSIACAEDLNPDTHLDIPNSPQDYNCNEIVKRTLADNPHIRVITEQEAKEIGCNMDEYMGAVVVAPKYDYHYYRMNDDGQWTHKPGYKPSTHLDADNNIIVNPKYANRKYSQRLNYKNFLPYLPTT